MRAFAVVIILGVLSSAFSPGAATDVGWGTAQLIETDDLGMATSPQVSVDGSGNVVAVWSRYDAVSSNIWSNRYVVGTGWGTAQLIETDDSEYAFNPQVSMDDSGNAIAVWCQGSDILSNRYVVGAGWGAAQSIEANESGAASLPQVSVDSSGNAIAVWQQYDGIRYNISSNRYVAGVGWGTAQLIEIDDSENALDPQVSMDGSGNAIAVWGQGSDILSNRYAAGAGWGTAQLIEIDDSGATSPQVSVDGSGNAIAVWCQYDGTVSSIYSNRYAAMAGWGTAELIETDDSEDASGPQVSVNSPGNAVVVWCQFDGLRYNLWSNRYTIGAGWGAAQLIETNNSEGVWDPHVSVDVSGNAIAVWPQDDGVYNHLWSNRYVVGTGWGTAQLIEIVDSGSATSPQVSVDDSGNAVTVWVQSSGGRRSIWSSRYGMTESVPVDVQVGVKGGDWIELDYEISGAPSGTPLPTWIKVEFQSVEGTTATVRITMHMSDGTEQNASAPVDIVAGGEALGLSGFVIPANCTTGDSIYMSGYGNVTIADETTRTYAGARRTVVSASFSQYGTELTYYWDKETGVMVEASTTSGTVTGTAIATETNMWVPESSGLLANPTVLFALAIGVVVIVVAVAFLVIRRRKEPPEFESPES